MMYSAFSPIQSSHGYSHRKYQGGLVISIPSTPIGPSAAGASPASSRTIPSSTRLHNPMWRRWLVNVTSRCERSRACTSSAEPNGIGEMRWRLISSMCTASTTATITGRIETCATYRRVTIETLWVKSAENQKPAKPNRSAISLLWPRASIASWSCLSTVPVNSSPAASRNSSTPVIQMNSRGALNEAVANVRTMCRISVIVNAVASQ